MVPVVGDLVIFNGSGCAFDPEDQKYLRDEIGIVLDILTVSMIVKYAKVYWFKEKVFNSHLINNLKKL